MLKFHKRASLPFSIWKRTGNFLFMEKSHYVHRCLWMFWVWTGGPHHHAKLMATRVSKEAHYGKKKKKTINEQNDSDFLVMPFRAMSLIGYWSAENSVGCVHLNEKGLETCGSTCHEPVAFSSFIHRYSQSVSISALLTRSHFPTLLTSVCSTPSVLAVNALFSYLKA